MNSLGQLVEEAGKYIKPTKGRVGRYTNMELSRRATEAPHLIFECQLCTKPYYVLDAIKGIKRVIYSGKTKQFICPNCGCVIEEVRQ